MLQHLSMQGIKLFHQNLQIKHRFKEVRKESQILGFSLIINYRRSKLMDQYSQEAH